MTKFIKENLVKNTIILILGFILFPFLKTTLLAIPKEELSDLLMILSLLLVTTCFANFAFSYEYADMKKIHTKLIAHFSTAIFMFLIMTQLEMLTLISGNMYPTLYGVLTTGGGCFI